MTAAQEISLDVCSAEFTKHGYASMATLIIQPSLGRYVATIWLAHLGCEHSELEEREVAWEPSEPEAQKLAVDWAFRKPVDAILECIEIDKSRRDSSEIAGRARPR